MLQPGQPAPAFKLFDHEKKEITLEDFRGKNVLLLFFPFAFSGTCTKELCAVRDDIASYNEVNAQVLGISIDSVFVQARYRTELQLSFPLLSDFNCEAGRAYDCFYEEFIYGTKYVTKRGAFVIGKDGVIRYAEVLKNASEIPDFEAIVQTLKSLG